MFIILARLKKNFNIADTIAGNSVSVMLRVWSREGDAAGGPPDTRSVKPSDLFSRETNSMVREDVGE